MAPKNYARMASGYLCTEKIDDMSDTVFEKNADKILCCSAITCPTSANKASSTWGDFKLINRYVEKYT